VKDRGTAIAMLTPCVLFVGLVFIYPLLLSLWTSFQYNVLSQPNLTRFNGLDNYRWLLHEPRFWDAFARSMVFLVFTVAWTIALGVFVALLLEHYCKRAGWLKALYLVPMVVTPVVVGIQWRFLLNVQFGVLNWMLEVLGSRSAACGSPPPSGRCSGDPGGHLVLHARGHSPLRRRAGIHPPEVRDAAQVDGTTAWQTVRYIILPMLKPCAGVILLIRTIGGLRAFDTILVITEGGPAARRRSSTCLRTGTVSSTSTWARHRPSVGDAPRGLLLTVLYLRVLR